jgi:autotransporter adhesin
MNTIYRIVWNATTCRWVVASEMAKGRKKSSAKGIASKLAAIGMMAAVAPVFALSTNGKAPLIVNDMSFNQTDGGNCQAIGGDGTNTFVNIPNCDANSMTSGNYKNARQTDSVVVAANSLSVGGYQYINGADGSNALTITQSGANILMNAGKITGLANGTAATDSVNVSQLTPLVSALGAGAAFNAGTGVVTGPSYSLTNANSIAGTSGAATDVGGAFNTVDTALGKLNTSLTNINNGAGIKYFHTNSVQSDSSATGGEAIAIGGSATASGGSAVAIGQNASSGGAASIAIGQNASIASGINNSLSIGGGSQSGNQSTSLGNSADTHLSSYAVAIGHATSVTGASGTALGAGAVASTTNSVALGANSTTTANLATAGYNPGTAALSGTASAANGEVSLGSAGKERRLTNVAAGANATDAVNVSQLQSEDAKVNNVASTTASALGTTVGANGAINAPSYTLANANSIGGTAGAATTVSSGFSKVDTALGTLNTAVTTAQTTANTANTTANKGWNLSADAGATSQNIAPGGTANFAAGTNATVARSGNTITMGVVSNPTFSGMLTANGGLTVGAGQTASMGGNKVTNVANGTLSAASTDAVNGSQLYATNQQVAQNTSDIAGNTTSISNITNQINSGTVGLVQQAAAGADLTVGKSTDGAAVNFADKNGNSRTLKNVTAGVAATDAVNMSQLNATNANVAGNTTAITNLGNRVTTNEGSISTINTTIAGMNGQLADAVKYDSAAHDTVTLGNAGTPVQVTNVKNGALSAASSDAVNGSQLYATNQQVAQNTTDIAVNTTAIAGNTTSINNITNQINSGTVGLVQQAAAGADLTVGKSTDGAAVNFADKNGATRTLKNVTAGVAATDAVNMSQLNATNANVAGNTMAITNLGNRVTTNEGSISTINTTIAGMNGQLADAVMYDSAAHDKVTLGNAGTPVQVTNVKNGALSAASTDAVNGSQLYATNQQVAQNTTDIAGNTTAIAGNTTSINNITNQINSGTVGLVQQAAAGADLTVGKDTDGTTVNFADKNGNTRTLKNVTAGVADTDAVNMSQLNTTNANVAGNTTAITNLGNRVTTTEGNISTINTTIAGMNGQLADAVMYDSAAHDKVTLGNAGTPVQVTNVKNGALSAASSDAVNGSQLYATNQQVTQNTTDIAGNTTSINSLQNTVNNISGGTVGLVQQAAAGADLTVGKGTDGVAVDFADKNGATRTLKNVTAGVADTDAVNVSQLNTTNANVTRVEGKADQQGTTTASAFGGGASYNSTTGAIVAPSYTLHNADGTTTTANDVGTALTNVDGRVVQNTTNIAGNTTAITNLQNNINNGTTGLVQQAAAGADLTVGKGTDGVAVDFADKNGATRTLKNVTAGVADTDAVNMSQLNTTNANVALNTTNIAGNTTAITNLQNNINNGTTGLVQQAAAGADLTVGKGTDGVAVDFADKNGATRTLKNVTAGVADTDAVNMSQLNTTNANVTRVEGKADQQGTTTASAFGGGASYNSTTGAIVAPSYTLHNADGTTTTANDVGTALTNVDGRVVQNTSDIAGNTTAIAGNTTSINNITNQINSGTVGLVQQAAAGADLTVGKATDGVAVDFAHKNGNTRTLKNVTAGVAATDAVNMSQLNATNANVAGNTTAITNLGNRVTTTEGNISTINTTIAGMNGQLADAVMYDSAAHDKVTLGNAGTPVQVTNVKNGALSAASSDAVNGSQLYATNQQVTQNTTDIAGNTTSINNITNQINSGTVGLVQQAAAGADLTVGKGTDGVAVDFADKNGATRTLKNVTAGVADTDAVNMSQLNTTNANVTRVEGKADQQGTTTASAFGGGASYNSTTGAIVAPSYTLHNADGTTTTANDVGTALTNIDGRVVQNTSDINTINTQINSGTIGLVQQASAGANLTVGKSTNGAAVDFQGTAGARKLLNVADGTVAAGSKDAVNGGQLYGVSQSMANAIGGGSTVNADGSISAPSYSVHNADGSTTTVNNAGSAISNLDGRVTQNTTDISTINTTINGMNGQLADAVKYDSAAHDKVTLGNAGTPVQVSNVKDGALSATSSDAVNGSQLYATNQQVAQNTGDIANINSTINTMNTGGLKYVQVNSTAAAANAAGSDSVAVGGNTKASAANAVAIGNGAQASQANSVALGAGSVADRANSVSVGAVGQERQVTNVAAGNLSATSTDAVNGSQLNATNQAVTNLDGRVTNVENTVNTMAGAVSNVTNITNGQSGMFQVSKDSNSKQPVASGSTSTAGGNGAVASGNNSTALGNAAVASADNSVAVGANSVADRSNSVSMGSAGHERQVTNVAAGTANTDAVNVGQLKAAGVMNADGSTNTAVTYDTNADGSSSVTLNGGGNGAVIHNVAPGTSATDAATVGQVQQVADWSKSYTDQQVRNMGRQADGGVASAMAMSSIPQAVVNGGHSIGAGVGSFRGQSSVAVSMSAMSATGKFAVKLNVSATTHGDAGVGVGASYNW